MSFRIISFSFIVLVLRCFFIETIDCQSIIVKDSGMTTHQIAMEFYTTVENVGTKAQTVSLQMSKCCQQNNNKNDAMDCETMVLHHLLPKELYPGDVKNCTIFYLNKYLETRHGYCTFKLKWRPINMKGKFLEETEVKIFFNKSSEDVGFFQKLFGGDKNPENLDMEDLTKNKRNVLCLVKYNGHKSYFNPVTNKCEKTPVCIENDVKKNQRNHDKEKTSKMIISSKTNKCKKVMNSNNDFNDEMTNLPDVTEVGALSYKVYPLKINCVHGYHNTSSLACECQPGWFSNPFPSKTFNPELDTYFMCNTKGLTDSTSTSEHKIKSAQITFIILLILLGIIFLICFIFIISYFCCPRKSNENRKSSSNLLRRVSSHGRSTINEIKNRREVILPQPKPYHFRTEVQGPSDGRNSAERIGIYPERAKSFDIISRNPGAINEEEVRIKDKFNSTKPNEKIQRSCASQTYFQEPPFVSKETTYKSFIKVEFKNPTEMQSQDLYAVKEEKETNTDFNNGYDDDDGENEMTRININLDNVIGRHHSLKSDQSAQATPINSNLDFPITTTSRLPELQELLSSDKTRKRMNVITKSWGLKRESSASHIIKNKVKHQQQSSRIKIFNPNRTIKKLPHAYEPHQVPLLQNELDELDFNEADQDQYTALMTPSESKELFQPGTWD